MKKNHNLASFLYPYDRCVPVTPTPTPATLSSNLHLCVDLLSKSYVSFNLNLMAGSN